MHVSGDVAVSGWGSIGYAGSGVLGIFSPPWEGAMAQCQAAIRGVQRDGTEQREGQ